MQAIFPLYLVILMFGYSMIGYASTHVGFRFYPHDPDTLLMLQNDTVAFTVIDTNRFIQADSLPQFAGDSIMSEQADSISMVRRKPSSTTGPGRPTVAVDSMRVDYYIRHFDSLYLGRLHTHDTSQIHTVDFDALSKGMHNYNTLSNTGLAHQKQILEIPFFNGFDLQHHSYRSYIRTDKDIRYLNPHQPFSDIYYTMGSKKEQQLNVSFARALAPRFYVGAEFYLVASPGPYRRSKSDNKGVYFTQRYHSANHRYGISAYYNYNRLFMQESGGIINDSIFENNIETDRRVIPVHLTNTENAENEVKHSGFGIEQYFNLSRPQQRLTDSMPGIRRIQIGRLTHRMYYARNQMRYTDENPQVSYYKLFGSPMDTLATNDSVYQDVIRNSVQWNNLAYKRSTEEIPFYLYGGIEHVHITHRTYSILIDSMPTLKRSYSQLIPFAGIQIGLFRSSYLDGKIRYITGDHSAGDLELDAGWKQYLGTTGRNIGQLFFRLRILNQTPSWFYQKYQSNYFSWENQFENSRYVSFTGGYQYQGVKLGGNLHILDRHIYLDRTARPKQTSGTIRQVHLFADFHLSPGKFDIQGSMNYQNSDNDTIIRLPELTAKLKITFTQDLFKRAATIQPGFSIHYNTPYFANAYMPALRAFYLQDNKEIGGYPYLDVFFGLKVKRANLFVKYTNLYGLAGDYTYYTVPGYPLRDPHFYFGVSWRFYQ